MEISITKLKILHAPSNIAGQMGILSHAQQQLGYSSHSCAYSDSWFGYKSDKCLNLAHLGNKYLKGFRIFNFFLSATWKYNVFHFHFGDSLLPWNCDLPILKMLGKKIVMHYWGSDIRQKSIAEKNNRFVKVENPDENRILYKIKRVANYVDTAIVGDYELYENIYGHFKNLVVIRQALDIKEYSYATSPNNKRPVIVHAPSNKGFKGTEFVLAAMDKLEKEYDLEFCLVHRIPHKQAVEIYQRADIIVDQLSVGSHGLFAIEAMALGKPVICYIRDDLRDTYPKELPIVSANPDNIYQQLKVLIEDPALRHELGLKGREYVEKYHDSLKIARQLIKLYENL